MKTIKRISVGLIAAAATLASVPAAANEIRAEVRGGLLWGGGTEVVAGAAVGYDADMGNAAFVGAEVSADKALVRGANTYLGLSGRGGMRLGPDAKLFGAGGYTFREGENVWHLGGGYEHMLNNRVYLKAEYRHFFSDFADGDQLVGGIGVKF